MRSGPARTEEFDGSSFVQARRNRARGHDAVIEFGLAHRIELLQTALVWWLAIGMVLVGLLMSAAMLLAAANGLFVVWPESPRGLSVLRPSTFVRWWLVVWHRKRMLADFAKPEPGEASAESEDLALILDRMKAAAETATQVQSMPDLVQQGAARGVSKSKTAGNR